MLVLTLFSSLRYMHTFGTNDAQHVCMSPLVGCDGRRAPSSHTKPLHVVRYRCRTCYYSLAVPLALSVSRARAEMRRESLLPLPLVRPALSVSAPLRTIAVVAADDCRIRLLCFASAFQPVPMLNLPRDAQRQKRQMTQVNVLHRA